MGRSPHPATRRAGEAPAGPSRQGSLRSEGVRAALCAIQWHLIAPPRPRRSPTETEEGARWLCHTDWRR
jgi:hypothetical protein